MNKSEFVDNSTDASKSEFVDISPVENILPAFNDTSPCTYKLFNDTSVSLSIVVPPPPPPAIVIVFVAPLPVASTPEPTKFNVVALVDNDEPSSCIVNEPLENKLFP